jgi:hypothetical protein
MAFQSNKQRKFLYELDKQKNAPGSLNMPVQKSAPISIPTSRPPQMTKPPQAFKLGAPKSPQFHPQGIGAIKPTSHPSIIPSLPAAPKFAKMKSYFKKPRGM